MPETADLILGLVATAVGALVGVTLGLYRDVAVLKEQASRHDGVEERLRAIEQDLAVIREILEHNIGKTKKGE